MRASEGDRRLLTRGAALLLLATGLPAQATPPAEAPRVSILPSGARLVVLNRPLALLHVASFAAAGVASEGPGEEGLAAILATESLTGTNQVGTTDWAIESRWLQTRDGLLVRLAREEGRDDRVELAEIEDRLRAETRPQAWLALVERLGAAPPRPWSNLHGFGLAASLPPESLTGFLALEAARLAGPALRCLPASSRQWREQRARETRDDPGLRARSALLGMALRTHPWRRALQPPPEAAALWQAGRSFWEREVLPARTVLACVGPWSEEGLAEVKSLFPADRALRPAPLPQPSEPPQEGPREQVDLPDDPPRALLGWRLMPDMEEEVLLLLADLLGHPLEGWLTRNLVEERDLLAEALVLYPFPAGGEPSLLVVEARPREGRPAEEAARAVLDFLPSWVPSEEEFAESKRRVLAALLGERTTPLAVAAGLAMAEAAGRGARGWWELPGRVERVTQERVSTLRSRIFSAERLCRLLVGPSLAGPGGGGE